jgi:predicted HAD superfamily Cof-like phosphohydrolase
MPTTNDPELFRDRWHSHVEEIEALKMSLDPEDFDELEEHLDGLHDLVDDAADEVAE